MNQIFTSNLSDGAKLIAIYLSLNGPTSEQQLASIFNKSLRTIYRYQKELSNLSSVSEFVFYKKPTNNTNKEIIINILKRYNKLPLLNMVINIISDKFDAQAFEYILQYCEEKWKKGLVKKFTPYFLKCLKDMWNEALIESRKPEKQIINYEIQEEEILRPEAKKEAQKEWDRIINQLNISPVIKNTWFKTAIPIDCKNNILTLSVTSNLAIEQIKKYCPYSLNFIIESKQTSNSIMTNV